MSSRRLVARAPATLDHQVPESAGGPVPVKVTDAAGDVLVDDAAVVDEGVAKVELTAVQLAAPTELTVEWDFGGGWVETDLVAVDGRIYLTPTELDAIRTKASVGTETQAAETLIEVVDAVEEFVHPFVPRFALHRSVPRWPVDAVMLDGPVLTVQAVTVAGLEVDGPFTVSAGGRLDVGRTVADGEVVEVRYVRGLPAPPADLKAAVGEVVEQLLRERYGRSQQPARAEHAGDGMSWVVSNPDPARGRLFGINRVDGVFKLYRDRAQTVAIG